MYIRLPLDSRFAHYQFCLYFEYAWLLTWFSLFVVGIVPCSWWWCKCSLVVKQEPLLDSHGWWRQGFARCRRMPKEASWLAKGLLPARHSSDVTEGYLLINRHQWLLMFLFALHDHWLGLVSSGIRDRLATIFWCTQVGSWECRDWGRTKVSNLSAAFSTATFLALVANLILFIWFNISQC